MNKSFTYWIYTHSIALLTNLNGEWLAWINEFSGRIRMFEPIKTGLLSTDQILNSILFVFCPFFSQSHLFTSLCRCSVWFALFLSLSFHFPFLISPNVSKLNTHT